MKKLISVLLAVLMLCGAFTAVAYAEGDGEDVGFTAVCSVYISPWNDGQIILHPAEGDSFDVEKGDSFSFTIETYNGYAFDQSTCVKIYPAKSFAPDLVLTNLDAGYGVIITPDEAGVYTIDAVEEDVVVAVFNLQQGNLPEVKNFLIDLFNFFLRLFRWFFGLSKDA